MKRLKVLSLAIAIMFAVSSLAACGNTQSKIETATTEQKQQETTQPPAEKTAENKTTKLTFISGKPEIQAQIEEMLKVFSQENPGIEMEYVAGQAGQSPYQSLTVMYNAGNAASVYMMEQADVLKLKDKVADLSAERFSKDAIGSALTPVMADGKLLAAPFITESVGLIYNKKIIEKAIGGSFDPNTIKTTNDLETLFKKVEATGVTPIGISPEDWSLGAHLMMYMYANQFPNSEENKEFTNKLRSGTADLINNKVYNGWVDTFDMIKKYNINKKDPLAANNDKNAAFITQGETAFWFMGTFIWPVMGALKANPSDFGLMPVPVSNNSADEGNTKLLSLFSMYLCVDKEQNSPEQQAASKKFIDWLLYSQSGQDHFINKMLLVPAYTHITLEAKDPLSVSLAKYIKANQTLDFNILYPSDHWKVLGGSLQKYLGGQSDRAGLTKEIETYWKNAK